MFTWKGIVLAVSTLCVLPAQGQDISAGLVGHWALDGSVQDSGPNGLHGQITGSLSAVADRLGNPGSALGGFTSSSYVTIPHTASLLPNSAFSAGGFFRFDNAGSGSQTLFSKSEGIDYALRLYNGVLDNLAMSYNVASFGAGSWHHVMMTWDGGTYRLWINGVQAASAAQGGPIGGFTMPLALGIELPEYSGGPYNPFLGAIDEFRFYSRALSTTEIQILAGLNVNQAPTAAITIDPSTGPAPFTSTLSGLGSSDPNGDPLEYIWDFGDGEGATGATQTHTYRTEATYAVRLTVRDTAGLEDTASLDLVVSANLPPIADFTFSYQNGARPLEVFFDASGSSDTSGDTMSFDWLFGDGQSAQGETVLHTFTDVAGEVPVTLTVTDSGGLSTEVTKEISVPNRAPRADFTISATEGMAPLTVEVTSTSSDGDGDAFGLTWDFGDGMDGSSPVVTHTYSSEGSYQLVLTVEDEFGATSQARQTITVSRYNTAPVAVISASPLDGAAPLTVSFDASGSSDSEGDPISYSWDFGDGLSGTGVTVEHVYNVAGTLTATLTVTDSLGLSGTATALISPTVPANTAVSSGTGGPWAAASSWVGGLVPSADQHVLITSAITGTGVCSGVTVGESGSWDAGAGATVDGPLTNNGTVTATGAIEATTLDNRAEWEAPAIVHGDLSNSGNWTGTAVVTGLLSNTGTFRSSTGAFVTGPVSNSGNWYADLEGGGDIFNAGLWSASRLTLNGSDSQRLGHVSGQPFETDLVLSGSAGKAGSLQATRVADTGRVVYASSPLQIVGRLSLGGHTLDMQNHQIRFSEGTWPEGGILAATGKVIFAGDGQIGEDMVFRADLSLAGLHTAKGSLEVDGDLRVTGALDLSLTGTPLIRGGVTNNGTITGPRSAVTVDGDVMNRGDWVVSIARVGGSITNTGRWYSVYQGTVREASVSLTGSGDRTINLDSAHISVNNGVSFRLVGDSRVRALAVSPNTSVEVAAGASLSATGFATSEGIVSNTIKNDGVVVTHSAWPNLNSTTRYGSVYRLWPTKSRTSDLDSLVITHTGAVPGNFADAVRSQWHLEAFPDDGVKRTLSKLRFEVPREVLNGHDFESLVVLHSEDEGQNWKVISTGTNTHRDQFNPWITIDDPPAWGDFILTSELESAVVRKSLVWSGLGDRLPVWGRRGARPFYLRFTNDTPIPSDAFFLTMTAHGLVQFDSFQSSNRRGPSDPEVRIEDQSAGQTRELYLYVNSMAPGESRVLEIDLWSDGTALSNKTADFDGLSGRALLPGGQKVTGAMTKAFLTDAVYNALFSLYGAEFEGDCSSLLDWTKAWFSDAFSRTTGKYASGNVPVTDILKDMGQDLLQKKGISLGPVDASSFVGEALTRFAQGVQAGVAGNPIPTCTGAGCLCEGPQCGCSGADRDYSRCVGPTCECAGTDCECLGDGTCTEGTEYLQCEGEACTCAGSCNFSGPDLTYFSIRSNFSVPEGTWYCPKDEDDCEVVERFDASGASDWYCNGAGCRCDAGNDCPYLVEEDAKIVEECTGPDCLCEGLLCRCTDEDAAAGLCALNEVPDCVGDGCGCTGPGCWILGNVEEDIQRQNCAGDECVCEGGDSSCDNADKCTESDGRYVIKCGDGEGSQNPGFDPDNVGQSDLMDFLQGIVPVYSWDPNDKTGPAGAGDEGYLSEAGCMDYLIRFENKAEASAAAFTITVVDTLDSALDPSTIEFLDASHDMFTMDVQDNIVTFEAVGILLPANVNPPEGEGYLAFSIDTRDGLESGQTIQNAATITFDFNEPIRTNTVINTLDFRPPITTMMALESHVVGDSAMVRWVVNDDGGSGMATAGVYRSMDGGPFELVGTTENDSLRIATPPGHDYAFYVLSKDAVGNTERKRPDPVYTRVTGVSVTADEVPLAFELGQNYPNPFNPRTTINYQVPESAEARLEVFDILGRRVAVLLDGPVAPGRHHVVWDASRVGSGVYFYRLTQGKRAAVQSMILVR